jgi:Domain of unknown function (DUF4214)
MTLDPDGCTFWYTNEYYAANGLNHQTRIGSFKYPVCTPVGAGGTLQGTVTVNPGGSPISGATIAFGSSMNESRSLVVRALTNNAALSSAVYNPSFVLMEYYGYLRRDADRGGYDFWLNVLDNRESGNYRGMVCAFISSTEYQRRFGTVITRSNAECGH